jgi:hypothetical protein
MGILPMTTNNHRQDADATGYFISSKRSATKSECGFFF